MGNYAKYNIKLQLKSISFSHINASLRSHEISFKPPVTFTDIHDSLPPALLGSLISQISYPVSLRGTPETENKNFLF